jgi:acyl dehydratase
MFPGKGYNQIQIGDEFSSQLTVTETHIVLGSGMFGDFNPLHVDQLFAERSKLGSRVLHGPFTSALVGGPVGNYFHGTAIAYLEHNCRYLAPVRAGDTLKTTWRISDKIDKPRYNGGIAVLAGRCVNQKGEIVLEATGKILLQAN